MKRRTLALLFAPLLLLGDDAPPVLGASLKGASTYRTAFFGDLGVEYIYGSQPSGSGRADGLAASGRAGGDLYLGDSLLFGGSLYALAGTGGALKMEHPSTDAGESRFYAGESYAGYFQEKRFLKAGRIKIDTPFAGTGDGLVPNLYEGVAGVSADAEPTTAYLIHVLKIAGGSETGRFNAPSGLGLFAGYGPGMEQGGYVDVAETAQGKDAASTPGLTIVGAINETFPYTRLQVWNYTAPDQANLLYMEGEHKRPSWRIAAQMAKEDALGEERLGTIDAVYYGLEGGYRFGSFQIEAAFSLTGAPKDGKEGGILAPWGGMPAFTRGVASRHAFLADTQSAALRAGYQGRQFLMELSYLQSEIGEASYLANTTVQETALQAGYKPGFLPGLELKGSVAFLGDYLTGEPWRQALFQAGYRF